MSYLFSPDLTEKAVCYLPVKAVFTVADPGDPPLGLKATSQYILYVLSILSEAPWTVLESCFGPKVHMT